MSAWTLTEIEQESGDRWIIRTNSCPVPHNKKRSDFPVCIYLSFHYQAFTEEGFPSSKDNDVLEAIEDELSSYCHEGHSVFVATVFMPKLKDFIIYTSEPDGLSDFVKQLAKPYGQFQVEVGGNEDPDWSQYECFA